MEIIHSLSSMLKEVKENKYYPIAKDGSFINKFSIGNGRSINILFYKDKIKITGCDDDKFFFNSKRVKIVYDRKNSKYKKLKIAKELRKDTELTKYIIDSIAAISQSKDKVVI